MKQPPTENSFLLTLSSYRWIFLKDSEHRFVILRQLASQPFRYFFRFLRSLFQKRNYQRDGDFFFYGLSSIDQFLEMAADPQTIRVVGFSYCEKPFDCPSGRFSADCLASQENPICRDCPLSKAKRLLSEKAVILSIPDVHMIGKTLLELQAKNPKKQLLFLISSCPFSLTLFSKWAHFASLKGIGVALSGRTCTTFDAFKLAEGGHKRFRTHLNEQTKNRYEELLSSLSQKVAGNRQDDNQARA